LSSSAVRVSSRDARQLARHTLTNEFRTIDPSKARVLLLDGPRIRICIRRRCPCGAQLQRSASKRVGA
jgi:hypothetical protein